MVWANRVSPKVSVIIASWNRSADLRLSLQAIFATGYPALEVVVVDNASEDDAAAVAASFPGVIVVRNARNLGFAEANLIGLGHCTGEYVALVNNDALLAPDWFARHVAFLEAHPDTAAVGGKQFFWDEQNPPWDRKNRWYAHTVVNADEGLTHAQLDAPDEIREVATLSGAAVMLRRAAIDDVGAPFLEPLFFAYYEETDFFARAVRKGWALHYTGEPACWHRVRASTAREPYRYLYLMHRNRVLWAYRNFDEASLARVLSDLRRSARVPLRARLRPLDDETRARRDASRWVEEHRALLEEHRARVYGGGPGFLDLARSIQSRASYYGYARPEVCALVPESARHVVDFGCAGGALGRHLKATRPGVEVRGVEPVASVAERARAVLDDVLVGKAEDPLPATWPRPDCIIFADVLEHLVDPWAAVRRARNLLSPDGTLVVSIPNVLHHSVASDLLRGRFDYRDAGVLDRTHLRFFTRDTAREMLEQAGFRVVHVERVLEPPARTSERIRKLLARTPPEAGAGLRARLADACTVQYLFVAR